MPNASDLPAGVRPFRSPDEFVPLARCGSEHDPSFPLKNHQVRQLVRKDSQHPEYRACLTRVGHQHLLHIPSFLGVLEANRENVAA